MAEIDFEPEVAPARPIGKVTSYGYASDPWKDSNSLNRIGAWNNRLTDDGLAISPDIETKFREAGIKPGDPVQLTLADGTQVVRRWQDRTAQDKQAARLGLKPLRGRFDFFNPSGVDERDGQGVVSFAKPGPPPEPDRSTEQLAAKLGPLPTDAQIASAEPVEKPAPVPFAPLPAVIESPRFDPVAEIPHGVSMASVGQIDFEPETSPSIATAAPSPPPTAGPASSFPTSDLQSAPAPSTAPRIDFEPETPAPAADAELPWWRKIIDTDVTMPPVQTDPAETLAFVRGGLPTAAGLGTGATTSAAATAILGAAGLTNPLVLGGGALLAGIGGFMGGQKAGEEVLKLGAEQGDPAAVALEQAATEHPGAALAGNLATIAAPVPSSLTKLAQAASIVRQAEGGAAATKFIAQQVGTGAAVGVGTDALMRGAGQALGWEGFEFSPEASGSAALVGALLGGHAIQFRDYSTPQVAEILRRGMASERAQQATPSGGVVPPEVKPLRPDEQKVYEAVRAQLAAIVAEKPQGTEFDPARAEFTARQVGGAGRDATLAESRVPVSRTKIDFQPETPSAASPRGPTSSAPQPSPAEPTGPVTSTSMVPVAPPAQPAAAATAPAVSQWFVPVNTRNQKNLIQTMEAPSAEAAEAAAAALPGVVEVQKGAARPVGGDPLPTDLSDRTSTFSAPVVQRAPIILPEHPAGGYDVADFIAENGGILLPPQGDRAQEYDGAGGLTGPYARLVSRDGAMMADAAAQAAYDAGYLRDPSPDVLFEELRKSADSRARIRSQAADQLRNEKQAVSFFRDVEKPVQGAEPIPVQTLNVGDTLNLRGEELRVVGLDPDTGDVTVEDGRKYGTQTLPDGASIWAEVTERAPVSDDAGVFASSPPPRARTGAAPVRPSAPPAGEVPAPSPERATFDAARAATEAPDFSPLTIHDSKGKGYGPIASRPLPGLRVVELPEMVQLAQDLGASLFLKKLPKAAGHFDPMGKGIIRLDPRVFANPAYAAKTLMHEIGHLIDWLPDRDLRRGNLHGRLWSLRKFMQDRFGRSTVSNKQLRAELLDLTQWWHPYDPATVPESYRKYRESSVELYAEFISVLYNSPADAKQLAPTFFREFFRGLDSKPDVKSDLESLQAWLHKPVKARLADRAANVSAGFEKGEATFVRKWEEQKARFAGYRGWLSRIKQAAFDHFAPVRDRAAQVGGATGDAIAQLFDSHPLASNEHFRWLEHLHRTVIEPAEAAGFSMDDLGQWLFFDRVANESYPVSERLAESLGSATGGRTAIANPLGHTPKTARDQLLITRLANGMRRQTLLDDAVNRFHDTVRDTMREAHAAGLLTDEQLATIEQNAQHYAAFTPLDYVDTFVPAGFFHQAGTLKEIANPFISTVLKVLQMQRAIQFQKVKTATVRLLADHFPGEIARAEVRRGEGGRSTPVPPRERGTGQIMLREAGKPAWFNVPAEIAAMFDRPDVPLLQSALAILDAPFRSFFYPLFITYNPIFQLVRNPLRDARRSYVNAPAGVGFWSIARQLPLIKQLGPNPALDAALAFVKQGTQTPLIAEMLENLAITHGDATSATSVIHGAPTAFDKILEQHGLLPSTEQPDVIRRFAGKIGLGKLADAIATVGRINEVLPKAAIYRELRLKGWTPADAAYYVRNFIGTPNFSRRGTHIGLANAFVPFINIWTKGWAADAQLAARGFKRRAHPDEPGKSPASYWMRWAMTSGVWTALKVAAGVGLLGAGLKQLFDGIGSFDKTNYDVLPIGYSGASEFNPKGKVAYFKVPKDPTDRLLSGVAYNSMNALAIAAAKSGVFGTEVQRMNAGADDRLGVALTKNFSVAAGDVPGLNPLVKIADGWTTYLKGQNPLDGFRGAHVLSDAEHLVGGVDALKPMLAWTIGQSGVQSFVRYDPQSKTALEIAAQNVPIVNGAVRISDYGFREQQLLAERLEDTAAAAARLALPTNARQLNTEHSFLRALGAEDRTPAQEARYHQLRAWHSSVWQPAEQVLRDAAEMRLSPSARRAIIDTAAQQSRPFEVR